MYNSMYDMEKIIKDCRITSGLSPLDIALKTNMNPGWIGDIENGQIRCGQAELKAIVKAIGVNRFKSYVIAITEIAKVIAIIQQEEKGEIENAEDNPK